MRIFVEYLLLPQFRISGALIILFGIPGFYTLSIPLVFKVLLWMVVLFVGLFLLLGSQQVEMNTEKKQYRSLIYVPIIFSLGKWKSYSYIENIFIKRSQESQRMAVGPIERTATNTVYDAYLKLSEEKLFLGSNQSKERLLKKIAPFKELLETTLIDYSED